MRAVELAPGNRMALDLYLSANMGAVGSILADLEQSLRPELRKMTDFEAADLQAKLKAIAGTVEEINQQEIERIKRENANAGRRRP